MTGIYFYDASVFEKIGCTKPSWRNELEITDVNNMYLKEGTLTHSILDGWWTDAGTFDSLLMPQISWPKPARTRCPGEEYHRTREGIRIRSFSQGFSKHPKGAIL